MQSLVSWPDGLLCYSASVAKPKAALGHFPQLPSLFLGVHHSPDRHDSQLVHAITTLRFLVSAMPLGMCSGLH